MLGSCGHRTFFHSSSSASDKSVSDNGALFEADTSAVRVGALRRQSDGISGDEEYIIRRWRLVELGVGCSMSVELVEVIFSKEVLDVPALTCWRERPLVDGCSGA